MMIPPFDFCIRSNKMILLYIFVSGFPPCFSQTLPSHFFAGPAPPQKIAEIKNQKSAVISLFKITTIKRNYNLRFKRCLIHFSSVLTERL